MYRCDDCNKLITEEEARESGGYTYGAILCIQCTKLLNDQYDEIMTTLVRKQQHGETKQEPTN